MAGLFLLERVPALQHRPAPAARRWTSNAGLFAIGSIVGGVVLPVGVFALAERQAPGLLSRLGLPLAAQMAVVFVLLDLWKYWEHRLLHRVPWLWRAHLVHHSDTAVDVTTTERHHPLEVAVSTGLMIGLVVVLGLPAIALGVYLVVATIVALYSHANVRLPRRVDAVLSRVIVTAPVHAVHHSDLRAETDSNYGAVLTVWDRLFGTFVDPARARIPHVGLEYFHRPADTGLWRVLQQPFRFRPGAPYPRRDDAPDTSTQDAPEPAVQRALLAGLASVAAAIAVTWPTLREMATVWNTHEAYQYAWLVLPMLAYLLAQPQARPAWHEARPGYSGVLVVAVAAAAWGVGTLAGVDAIRALCLVLMVHGIALATLGGDAYRRLFPVLALLFFLVPSADVLQPALRILTLESIDRFCALAGLPHTVDGFVVHVQGRRYVVVDECAGLTYVTLASFLGYCFGLLVRRSLRGAVGMGLLGAGLGIACNLLRVNAIVLVDAWRDTQMDLAAHGALQWIMLLAALGALTLALGRARPDSAHAPASAPRRAPPAASRWSPIVAGGVAIIVAGSVLLATLRTGTPVVTAAMAMPRTLAQWELVSPAIEAPRDAGTQTRSLRASYRRDAGPVDVVVIEALSPQARLLESALAPGAHAVWREKHTGDERACVEGQCITLRHATWQREHSDDVRHVYYAYDVGGYVTPSRLAARMAQGWRRLRGDPVDARITAFDSVVPLDAADLVHGWVGLRSAFASASAVRVAGRRGAAP